MGDKNYLKELCLGVAMRWRAMKSKDHIHHSAPNEAGPLQMTIRQGFMKKGCGGNMASDPQTIWARIAAKVRL